MKNELLGLVQAGAESQMASKQFPKIGGPFLVVLVIRALLFGDLYWDP